MPGRLRIYLPPGTPGIYGIALDPSMGYSDGDPCAYHVMRFEDWRTAAVLTGHLTPDRQSAWLLHLCVRYGRGSTEDPLAIIECPGPGHVVIDHFRGRSLPLRIYGSRRKSGVKRPGFYSTGESKSFAFAELRRLILARRLKAADAELLEHLGNIRRGPDDEPEVDDRQKEPDHLACASAMNVAVRLERLGMHPIPAPGEEAKEETPKCAHQRVDPEHRHDYVWDEIERRRTPAPVEEEVVW